MSSRLNYARAKRRAAPGFPPWPSAKPAWRTEWPEEFPVEVTRVDLATDSRDLTEEIHDDP